MGECSRCLRANKQQADVVNAARLAIEDDTEQAWMNLAAALERLDKAKPQPVNAIHYSS